jgi:excisionase family DNA binding protein
MQNVILTPLTIEQLQSFINDAVKSGIEQTQPTQSTTPKLLTRKQVCDLLSITPPTLHEWTRNGTISAYKVGTRVRYKESEVIQTLQRIQLTKIKKG